MKNLVDLEVPRVGLGCMGMSEFYGPTDEAESLKTLHAAFDIGYRHFDTSDMYGRGHNEELLGRFVRELGARRKDALIASKFGIYRDPDDKYSLLLSGKRAYVQRACEASLRRLKVECIDLYYVHRRDPETPIEETIEAMADLVKEGKIGAIGLCEVSVDTLRRAHRVHPVSALQNEYSLWTRDVEGGMLSVCQELDVSLVAYSPLGRGFLTGKLKKSDVEAADPASDFRVKLPRFQGDNFDRNYQLVEQLKALSDQVGFTPSQLALAWLLHQYDKLHVIPGTKRLRYLADNFSAKDIKLEVAALQALGAIFNPAAIVGERYPEAILRGTNI